MNPIHLEVPQAATILFNSLHRSRAPELLTQGLLAIRLPANRVLDVSWYPERDPSGAYTITVFRSTWDQQEHEVETKDPDEVVRIVQNLCQTYCEPVVPLPAATNTTVNWPPSGRLARLVRA